MATMTQSFLRGETVEGKYTLMRYLGGSDHSAVFQTQYGSVHPRDAAIKLQAAPPGNTAARLSGWRLAANISHPHLTRILDMGRCEVGNAPMLYVVTELADENLAEILPQRPLTTAEARDMLASLLDALVFLHNRGFVHGHIKPSNIMAVGEQLKLSSDTICRLGEPVENGGAPSAYDPPEGRRSGASSKADIWSLGVTLVEVLTQQPPEWDPSGGRDPVMAENLPPAFAEIARHCLRRAPNKRWSAVTIDAHLPRVSPSPVAGSATAAAPQAAPQGRRAAARSAEAIPRIRTALAQVRPKMRDASQGLVPIAQRLADAPRAIARMVRDTQLPKIRIPEMRMPQARRYATGAVALVFALLAIAAGVKFARHGGSPSRIPARDGSAIQAAKSVAPVTSERAAREESRRGVAARREKNHTPERFAERPERAARGGARVAPHAAVTPTQTAAKSLSAEAAEPTLASASQSSEAAAATDSLIAGRVLQRVMPSVPRSASNTIWGTVRVGVRVRVDASGHVTQAELQAAGPSRYFARLSLEAARRWHFAAPKQNGQAVGSLWLLHFGYRHDGMGVDPTEIKP